MVEETQIVLKTVKELTSKEASDRARAKIKMMKVTPQREVDISSDEDTSSSEDIKDDEKPPTKQPDRKTQFVFINFETIPRTIQAFDHMAKTWQGFPQALSQIGLNFEKVQKRLQQGKTPYEDEEEFKKDCEEALKRLQEAK